MIQTFSQIINKKEKLLRKRKRMVEKRHEDEKLNRFVTKINCFCLFFQKGRTEAKWMKKVSCYKCLSLSTNKLLIDKTLELTTVFYQNDPLSVFNSSFLCRHQDEVHHFLFRHSFFHCEYLNFLIC